MNLRGLLNRLESALYQELADSGVVRRPGCQRNYLWMTCQTYFVGSRASIMELTQRELRRCLKDVSE